MTPQELKSSILQLAIQGKLVPQRPEEGTAQELYAQIQQEKQRLIAAGKIKKEKPLPEITEDEKPFDIPESWMWVRLKNIASVLYGYPFDSTKFNTHGEGLPLIRIRDVLPAKSATYTTESVSEDYVVHDGDMLIGMDGNFNIAFWNGGNAYLNQRVCKVVTDERLITARFLYHYFPNYLDQVFKTVSFVTVRHLSDKHLTSMIVPLPPLAEQQRIVEKMNSLVPYVQRFEQAWNKLEAFNKRFPGDMQKSLLQMAIQGKLVEQRPEEGTGEELYQQIQAEKKRLIAEGKIKREKPLPEITEDEIPFEIPEGWKWCRLPSVADMCLGKMLDKQKNQGILAPYLRNVNVRWGDFELDDLLEMRFEDVLDDRFLIQKNDLVMCEGGEPGRCAVWKDETPIHFQKALHRIRFAKFLSPNYFYYVFSLYANNGIFNKLFTGTTIKHLTGQSLDRIIVPLPPIAEQKRIVERLEETLAVCARLK